MLPNYSKTPPEIHHTHTGLAALQWKCCSKGCVRSLSIYQVQLPTGKTSAINQFHSKLLFAGLYFGGG